jgi:hypothetical protein
MKNNYSLDDVLDILRAQVALSGSQEAFAQAAGVSQQYVGDVLRGKREPGQKILRAIGLRKVSGYQWLPLIRLVRRTGKIEFKREGGLSWYPMPKEWTFDKKAQEFVYRKGTAKESRFQLSEVDAKYLIGELPASVHGEIVISLKKSK